MAKYQEPADNYEEESESCVEKASELLQDVQEKYPNERAIISKIEEVIGDLEKIDSSNEESEEEDENYDEMNADKMGDSLRKKGIIVGIKLK